MDCYRLLFSLTAFQRLLIILNLKPGIVLDHVELGVRWHDWIESVKRLEERRLPGFVLANEACHGPDGELTGILHRLELRHADLGQTHNVSILS